MGSCEHDWQLVAQPTLFQSWAYVGHECRRCRAFRRIQWKEGSDAD